MKEDGTGGSTENGGGVAVARLRGWGHELAWRHGVHQIRRGRREATQRLGWKKLKAELGVNWDNIIEKYAATPMM